MNLPRYRYDQPLAENGLIGTLLICPELVGEARESVQPEDIGSLPLATVYRTMLNLWERGVKPSVETVLDELRVHGQADQIGGRAGLVTLLSSTGVPRLEMYVPVVLEHSLRRRVILAARQLEEISVDPAILPADALDAGKMLLDGIDVPTESVSEAVPVETFVEGQDTYVWLVPYLIERGERIIVVAAEASGKSMMLRQIAVCAAYGLHPFTFRPVEPMRVLLIDLENPESMIRRKVRPMVVQARHMRPQAQPGMMQVLCRPSGIDVTKRGDSRWLTGQLAAAKPDLVVVGPLYKMFSGDDKWEQGARTVTTLLDDLRSRLGFALIMETHAPQAFGGGQRNLRPIGSSLWMRWPEFGISFSPVPSKSAPVVKVKIWKARDERDWPRFLQQGGEFPWTPCADPEGPKGRPEPQQSGLRPGFGEDQF